MVRRQSTWECCSDGTRDKSLDITHSLWCCTALLEHSIRRLCFSDCDSLCFQVDEWTDSFLIVIHVSDVVYHHMGILLRLDLHLLYFHVHPRFFVPGFPWLVPGSLRPRPSCPQRGAFVSQEEGEFASTQCPPFRRGRTGTGTGTSLAAAPLRSRLPTSHS